MSTIQEKMFYKRLCSDYVEGENGNKNTLPDGGEGREMGSEGDLAAELLQCGEGEGVGASLACEQTDTLKGI